jgi:hypothetical protein
MGCRRNLRRRLACGLFGPGLAHLGGLLGLVRLLVLAGLLTAALLRRDRQLVARLLDDDALLSLGIE